MLDLSLHVHIARYTLRTVKTVWNWYGRMEGIGGRQLGHTLYEEEGYMHMNMSVSHLCSSVLEKKTWLEFELGSYIMIAIHVK